MLDDQNRALIPPHRGLFRKIIKRLGLEKELQVVEEHIKFFVFILSSFVVLSVFAVIGMKEVLAESSFGPFLSLIFSDPGVVLSYWQSFALSVFESMPFGYVTICLTLLALILFFSKLAGAYLEKSVLIIKTINKNKYGKYK